MDAQLIKETVGLREVALPEFHLKDGYQNCPFCSRSRKFKVTGDRWFKCFHPGCKAAAGGDIFTFLQLSGKAPDFQSAVQLALPAKGRSTRAVSRRLDTLRRAFNAYTSALNDDKVLAFLSSRGWGKALLTTKIGFAPTVTDTGYLQFSGLALDDLVAAGLAYESGREFFNSRIIFAVTDRAGQIVHLQGRSILPDSDLRWLSTPSTVGRSKTPIVSPINAYVYNEQIFSAAPSVLYLTEGISDGYSLLELGLDAISCFGLEPQLTRYADSFSNVKTLIAVFDNDRYPQGQPLGGAYKSWSRVIHHLIELSMHVTSLQIYCLVPPQTWTTGGKITTGIKDVNDWLRAGLDTDQFVAYVKANAVPLVEFAFDLYGPHWEYQAELIRLVAHHRRSEDIARLEAQPARFSTAPTDYYLNAFQYD